MVYDTIGDEDVIEVLEVQAWRAVYAVETGDSVPPPAIPVTLDFDDDEVTAIRPPSVHLLTGEPSRG